MNRLLKSRFLWSLALGCVGWLAAAPANCHAGTANGLMDISQDGALLICSNRDSGTVTVVDLKQHAKVREIRVGSHPEGVTFLGATHQFAVAVYNEDVVAFYDADSGDLKGKTEVFDEPYGVVSNRAGSRIYVTLDYPGRVLAIDARQFKIEHEWSGLGNFLRGLAIAQDERRLIVTEYYTGTLKAIDAEKGQIVDQWPGVSGDNLVRQVALHPTRPKAYFPHMRSKITAVHGEGSIFPYLGIVDLDDGPETHRRRVPMDAFRGALVTANPWETTISPDGQRMYLVFAGTDDMFVGHVLDDNYREVTYAGYVRVGSNPRAVRVSPDSRLVYVYNALDFNITVLNSDALRPVAMIQVTDNPLSEKVLLGKKLFYSAQQPMVGRRWISCSSCHPDGEPDGRTWHNPDGLRNTQSFAGMAWTHPVHWSADRDEVQDFENTIRGPLMQGRGLIVGTVHKDLGDPNRGISKELDALAAYSNSHKFTLSPHSKQGLSAAAQRGRELFFSAQTKCATCHSGPLFTDSQPRAVKEIVRHDVGTGNDDPSEKMGPAYDTPTLHGLYRTAPYLHHGRAATLEEVLTAYNSGDEHGVTSHLSPAQITDLAEFLRALPYEQPEPLAEKAGLQPVFD